MPIEAGRNKGGFAVYFNDFDGILLELLQPPMSPVDCPAVFPLLRCFLDAGVGKDFALENRNSVLRGRDSSGTVHYETSVLIRRISDAILRSNFIDD